MAQTIMQCFSSWKLYWGDGRTLILAGLLFLYLLTRRRKKKGVLDLLLVIAVMAAFFFFPPTALALSKAIDGFVYWRTLWILPLVPLMALGATYFVKECPKGFTQVLIAVVIAGAIALCGRGFWTEYERLHNNQQVPDALAGAIEIINADRQGKAATVATNDANAAYVRVYDATLTMPYGRAGRGAISKNAVKLYRLMNQTPKTDYEDLAKKAKKTGCDYLIIQSLSKKGKKILKEAGFKKIGKVDKLVVMKRRRKKKS